MKKSDVKLFIGVFVYTAVIAIVCTTATWFIKKDLTPQPVLLSYCTSAVNPCVELLTQSGNVVAKFNDFIEGTDASSGDVNCVYYSTDGSSYTHFCGIYTLKWIGPVSKNNVGFGA